MTIEDIQKNRIMLPSEMVYRQVKARWDSMAKPLDGMGQFEELTARIGAILGTADFVIDKKAVVVLCADNGIVEEGVSQSGQDVTWKVASFMGTNRTSVGKMAGRIGADILAVDVGINHEGTPEGLIAKKIVHGTKNFRREPAMSEQEAVDAIAVGMDMAALCKEKGYQVLAVGEMGIGNTTTSSAVAAALTGCSVEDITGRGAGLDDAGLMRKRRVIAEALQKYQLKENEPLRILSSVGGLDIAGMAGLYIGGALYHLPIVLDGVISVAAALIAERLMPGVRRYLIASHKSREPAAAPLLKELELFPVIDASLALGEGTGAVMMFALLDMAMCLYTEHATFSDIRIEQYTRF